MAYRYCYNALSSIKTVEAVESAKKVSAGVSQELYRDIVHYDAFFSSKQDKAATTLANSTNDAYLRTSGESAGIASYGQVCDLLVNWHIQEVVLPSITVEESHFDPYDEAQVDISDIR